MIILKLNIDILVFYRRKMILIQDLPRYQKLKDDAKNMCAVSGTANIIPARAHSSF